MIRIRLALLAAAIAAPLAAQASPGQLGTSAKDTVFTVANLDKLGLFRSGATNKAIVQINLTKTPNRDIEGQWTAALTLRDLAPAYGGSSSGGQYVVSGQYDQEKQTFTPNKDANAVNNPSNGDTLGMMIEPRDGICCTVDQKDGIYFSLRDNTTQVFPKPLRIVPGPSTPALPVHGGGNPYVSSVPCFVDKTTIVLIFADGKNSIIQRELTLNFNAQNVLTSVQAGSPVTVYTSTDRPHSPSPIIDRDGNVQGLLFAIGKGNDSDMYFLPAIDGKTQALKVYDDSNWLGSGGSAGGRFFFANASDDSAAYVGDVSWLLGSVTPIGNLATMTLATRNKARPLTLMRSILAMSLQPNNGTIKPVPLPGWNGAYALNLPMEAFSSTLSADKNEVTSDVLFIPSIAALKGISVALQAATQPTGAAPTLSNTAFLKFK